MDEVAALTTIRSKHVVELYDVIRDDNGEVVALVEEFLPGQDLDAVIPVQDQQPFLRIAYAIACGLADIHATGRVHRDIKPNNMKFDAEGCLKIFDFGLARVDPDDAATQGAVGTIGYMAPELCVDFDETASFTQAVDVYAYGATLLKLVRGNLPAEMRRVPPAPSANSNVGSLSLVVAPEIAQALNSCLAQAPQNRPSMATIRDLLGMYLLRDQHRASLVVNGTPYVLDAQRKTVTITLAKLGSLTLAYDGLRFSITASTGAVYVNNVAVAPPHRLPGACVITLGEPALGWARTHIPVDISHPEVVL